MTHAPVKFACMAAALILGFTATAGAQDLDVTIGHVAATSGRMAAVGRESENGARLAVEELNLKDLSVGGRRLKFKLLAKDDAADPNQAAEAARALVAASARGVVGHLTSGTSIAAAKVYSDAGIAQISPSATAPAFTAQGLKTSFRVIASDTAVGAALGRYAVRTMKARRFAVLDDRSAYGRGLADEFARAVVAAGGSVVQTLSTSETSTDFGDVLAAVKAQQPDVLFFGGVSQQAGPLLAQLKQAGIDARFMGGDGLCQDNMVSRWAGVTVTEGEVVCAAPGGVEGLTDPAMASFQDGYERRFGARTQHYGPYAYDAVRLLADAIVRAGSPEPAKILSALAQTRGYPGVTGPISFDDHGDLQNAALSIYTYKGSTKTLVEVVR